MITDKRPFQRVVSAALSTKPDFRPPKTSAEEGYAKKPVSFKKKYVEEILDI